MTVPASRLLAGLNDLTKKKGGSILPPMSSSGETLPRSADSKQARPFILEPSLLVPVETRLRAKIDLLQDELEQMAGRLETARRQAANDRAKLSSMRRARDLWRTRAHAWRNGSRVPRVLSPARERES